MDSSTPKCLKLVGNRSILEIQLTELFNAGVTKAYISLGYHAELVSDWLSHWDNPGIELKTVFDTETIGTANAVFQVCEIAGEQNFIIVPGDLFLNLDISSLLQSFISSGKDVAIYSHPNSHPSDSDLLFEDFDGSLIFLPKNRNPNLNFRNNALSGLVATSKKFLKKIEPLEGSFESQLIEISRSQKSLALIPIFGIVMDTGTPARLKRANEISRSRSLSRIVNKVPVVLMDLDDTILQDTGVSRYSAPVFYPDALEFIEKLNHRAIPIIILTNQPSLAKGEITDLDFYEFIKKCEMLLSTQGLHWDSFYFCPHHPQSGFQGEVMAYKIVCGCRKPAAGLFDKLRLDASEELQPILMIGDSGRDWEFSMNLAIPFAHIQRNENCRLDCPHDCYGTLAEVEINASY
jgi:histidinol-phosphate phosphatase family protein